MFLVETLTIMAGSVGVGMASLKAWRYRRDQKKHAQEQLDLEQYLVPVVGFVSQSAERCPKCDAAPSMKNATFRISRSKFCQCEEIPFGHFHSECVNSSLSLWGMKLPSGCGARWITKAKGVK